MKIEQVHYDISTAELYGAYPDVQAPADADPGIGPSPATVPTVPFPTYGRTKHVANLNCLKELLPRHRYLYLGGSKLDTPENLVAAQSTAGEFVCAGAFTQKLQARFRKVRNKLQPIDYCSQADAQRPPEERDQYQACEVTDAVRGQYKGRSVRVQCRLIFIHSSSKAKQQATTRERHLAKIRAEFEQVQKILGKYSLKTTEAIGRRLEQARSKYAEGKAFRYTLKCRAHQFKLTWQIDEAVLARLQELDGVFVLKTNRAKDTYPIVTIWTENPSMACIRRTAPALLPPARNC